MRGRGGAGRGEGGTAANKDGGTEVIKCLLILLLLLRRRRRGGGGRMVGEWRRIEVFVSTVVEAVSKR